MDKLPVLNYHVVQVREGEYGGSVGEREYFISKKVFRGQLEFLRKEKFVAIGISKLKCSPGVPPGSLRGETPRLRDRVSPRNDTESSLRAERSEAKQSPTAFRQVMLTFDDGHLSHYEHVMPLLIELEMTGAFFIPVGLVGGTGCMDWRQIQELASNGFDIGSHGFHHIPLTQLDGARLRAELTDSKKVLEDRLGKEIASFSVPRGFYNARVRDAAREAGYGYVFTSRFGLNLPNTDSLALLRIAVKAGTRNEEFMNWMNGEFGLKECVEGVKDAVRGFVPPALYDFAASLKRYNRCPC